MIATMPLTLVLRVVSYRGEAAPAGSSRRFGANGGSVGRTAENDLVLPDPGKYVSRHHARIECLDGVFHIQDTGANATILNGQPLGGTRKARLESGDELTIGDYMLEVSVEAEAQAGLEAALAMELDPLPDPLSGDHGAVPGAAFDISMRDDAPPQALPFKSAASLPATMPAAPAAAAVIPEDYDPLASRIAGPAIPRPRASPAAPQAVPPRAPAQRAATASVDAGSAAAADPTLAALLHGLGLGDLPATGAGGPELAELCGQMLRVAIGGIMQTLAARATAKNEIRMDRTLVAIRDNNPLKFLPDAGTALAQMLSGRSAGYLPAVAAIAAAVDDIRSHEVAMMAGMRAALEGILERFDPVAIERGLGAGSALDRMIAAKRKAHLWDRMVEVYGDVARGAGDDVQKLFRERFNAAYEEQVHRLKGLKAPAAD